MKTPSISNITHDVSQYIFWDLLDLCSRLQFSMVNKMWHEHYKTNHNDKQKKIKLEDEKIITIQKQAINLLVKYDIKELKKLLKKHKDVLWHTRLYTGKHLSHHAVIADSLRTIISLPTQTLLRLQIAWSETSTNIVEREKIISDYLLHEIFATDLDGNTPIHTAARLNIKQTSEQQLINFINDIILRNLEFNFNTPVNKKGETILQTMFAQSNYETALFINRLKYIFAKPQTAMVAKAILGFNPKNSPDFLKEFVDYINTETKKTESRNKIVQDKLFFANFALYFCFIVFTIVFHIVVPFVLMLSKEPISIPAEVLLLLPSHILIADIANKIYCGWKIGQLKKTTVKDFIKKTKPSTEEEKVQLLKQFPKATLYSYSAKRGAAQITELSKNNTRPLRSITLS